MTELKHMSSDESITVIYEGKPWIVKKGQPQFAALQAAIKEKRWDDVPNHLTVTKTIAQWSNDKFKVEGDEVTYLGQPIPDDIKDRVLAMVTNGENPSILFNFWERLNKNPSYRSVKQLFSFMKHTKIALTPEGKILTYKSVRENYKDVHSGKFDNRPGTTNKMPRNKISDDPEVACHEGFHVGAKGYVEGFHRGGRIVICEVDPENVVCIPYDAGQEKMRVCEYVVIGNYGSDLPDTSVTIDQLEYKGHVTTAAAAKKDGDDNYDRDDEDDWEGDKDDTDDEIEQGKEKKEDPDDDDADDDGDDDDSEVGLSASPPDNDLVTEIEEEEEKPSPTRSVAKKAPVKKKLKKYEELDAMDMSGLTLQSLDDLRKYATYGLEIIGASKIPGGKVALITRILRVRDGNSD